MATLHMKYVLVGGGGAGSAAAEAIRRHDPIGSILLVGQEISRPYLRPALSKEYLRRQIQRSELGTEPVGWYSERHIDMRTGRRVARLDSARHALTLDSGEEIAFDKLLLATGAAPKPLQIPGADLPNVYYLRTIEDADRLHHAIDKAKSEGRLQPGELPGASKQEFGTPRPRRGRVVVIGSGLLAVELAASFRQMELPGQVGGGRSCPWGKFAGESTGRFLSRYLESQGVIVHPKVAAERLEGDGRVQRVVTSDGASIDCDFVVAAKGILVNRDLLRDTPIAAEMAILVDEHCQTNVGDIYAAGDCAAVFDPLFGKHRILDHWDSARVTGAIAGANMAGAEVRYDSVNSFSSNFFALTLHAWGEGRFVDRRLVRGTPNIDAPDFVEIGVAADGRVAQALAIGRSREHGALCELVRRRFNVDGQEEALRDPNSDLRQLLG